MGFSSCQDKNNMRWWFLQCLKQGVGGFFGEHMDFVDNIDFVTGLVGRVVHFLTEVSDFINAAIAGRINLDDIQSRPLGDCLAHGTGITWLILAIIGKAIYGLGQNAPGAGLAGASGTAEKIGMRYVTATQGVK